MSIRNILAVVEDTPEAEPLVAFATVVAGEQQAHLVVLAVAEIAALDYGYAGYDGIVGATVIERMDEAHERAGQLAARLKSKTAAAEVSVEVRQSAMSTAGLVETVARQGRYAELIMLGRPAEEDRPISLFDRLFDAALFGSGRPVVVVPPAWSGGFARRIVVAWDGGREAARAVAAAMPLIEAAEEVRVALANPGIGDDAHGQEPGADLGAALARHNPSVAVDRLPQLDDSVAGTLLRHAGDSDADLLVLGGYGHARLAESVFGGVTRDVIRGARLPFLMAH